MKRILVIDDEPSIGKALTLGLSSHEMEVDVAEDGASGVRLGCEKHYDILIADLYLPDLDGLEVIQRIRTHCPEIISIVITGNPSRESFDKAAEHCVCAYLEKPLDMQSLKDAIRRGLERRLAKPENGGASEPLH